jgi:hypothetical protein
MTWVAAAIATSAVAGAYSARKGAKGQEAAADKSAEVQREIFQKQTELAEPFRQAGISSQNELLRLLGLGGDTAAPDYGMLTRGFGEKDLQMDPGFGFRLREGEKALERMQSARGNLLSGGAIKAGQRYSQDLASSEYMNAFNRAQAQLGTRLGTLGSLYGAGQAAAQQVAGQAGQYGENVGNLLMAGGAARASGYAGAANALNQALGQYVNYKQGQDYLKRRYPTGEV